MHDMNYAQREAAARSIYEQALKRVRDTLPPAGQKFLPGKRVRVGTLPLHASHFEQNCLATVLYTYRHAFGFGSVKQYCLDIDGHGSVAWYDEEYLEPA